MAGESPTMEGEVRFRLTVWLRDGREISGEYNYLGALARLELVKMLNVSGWRLEPVVEVAA